MVIVKLIGGLGNQLFQYALGRKLSHRLSTTLKLDITAYASDPLRDYSLSPFNIKAQFASTKELAPYHSKLFRYMPRLSQLLRLPFGWTLLQENRVNLFDSRIESVSGNVYLKGYWQSERYFADIAETIRQEFAVTAPLSGRNAELAGHIQECQSVSLHVRRGDYVTNPVTKQAHGICSLAYYDRAVAHIASSVSRPIFFVFSDDPAWVRENLILPFPTHIVDHNDSDHGYEDIRLMSLCSYHIIANSSFSWWGAWLNNAFDKIVIAPKIWFRSDIPTTDLIPDKWVKL